MKQAHNLRLLLSFLCLMVWFGFLSSHHIEAQTCTSQHSPQILNGGWLKATNVQVYIDPAIIGDRRDAVVQAFNNWNAASGSDGNNSRVSYTIVTSPPPAGSNAFTIVSTPPVVYPGVRAETSTFSDQYGHTTHAETKLDPM